MTNEDDASLEPGDLVWVDFDPVRGSEQRGVRPAMVISATAFNANGRRSIVCPITGNERPWPTKVPLPEGLPVRGAVLVDQIRSLDRGHRGFRLVGRAPAETVERVREVLMTLLSSPGARP